jgi:transposase
VIDKHKMKKHFALDIADGRFAFRRRGDEIAAEARLDGIYVVRTSLPADKVGSEQAVAAYKSLALVERAFRTLKGVDMQVRPIYHWLSTRVKAHVFLCMLAYHVEHHMRVALAPLLFADHDLEKRERSSIVRRAEPSKAAKRKITRRQSGDGTPIMAWHDLIANLGTLTINEVTLPIVERQTFHMLARPTALQEQIYALLGLPTPRVQ